MTHDIKITVIFATVSLFLRWNQFVMIKNACSLTWLFKLPKLYKQFKNSWINEINIIPKLSSKYPTPDPSLKYWSAESGKTANSCETFSK